MKSITKSSSFAKFDTRSGAIGRIKGVTALSGEAYFRITLKGKTAYIARNQFVMDAKQVKKDLLEKGVAIFAKKDWSAQLDACEAIDQFIPKPLADRAGWFGPYFAESGGYVHSPDGAPKAKSIFSTKAHRNQHIAGTHKDWLKQIAIPLTGQHIPMISILAAFAAPLVRSHSKHNIGFELWGPPARGKSTCLELMTSVAMPPEEMANFNSTPQGMEKLFKDRCDLPFAVDEANLMGAPDRQAMQNFAFRMASGSVRTSFFAQDRTRHPFVYMTSSNRPIQLLVGSTDADTAAATLQRLLPLEIPDTELGVFDSLPAGFQSSGHLANHLANAMRAQHGTAMRKFLRHLVNARHANEEKLTAKIHQLITSFNEKTGYSLTDAGQSRASNAFGLLYAAGEFAVAKGVLPADWNCLEVCLAGYRNYQRQLPGQTPFMTRLATLASSPQTIDLRGLRKFPKMSNSEFRHCEAFIRKGKKGITELLVPVEDRDAHFPDWEIIIRSREFAMVCLGTKDRKSVQRTLRKGKKQWFLGFNLPPQLVPPQRP